MEQDPGFIKHLDLIGKAEFIRLFAEEEKPEAWFTENEQRTFSMKRNAGSLAARYLIKKRICEQVGAFEMKKEIEIMNDDFGKPKLQYGDNMLAAMDKARITKIMCSISHSRNFITGMTIFCFREDV
jgi:phosphopantetheinyl transferase (holo-ACP synthase)